MENNQINNEYVQKGYLKAYLANRGIKVISYDEWEHLCDCIDDAKAEDVRENVSGEWIKIDYYYKLATCSQCNRITMFETWGDKMKMYSFCPNCGADMRGEQDG